MICLSKVGAFFLIIIIFIKGGQTKKVHQYGGAEVNKCAQHLPGELVEGVAFPRSPFEVLFQHSELTRGEKPPQQTKTITVQGVSGSGCAACIKKKRRRRKTMLYMWEMCSAVLISSSVFSFSH